MSSINSFTSYSPKYYFNGSEDPRREMSAIIIQRAWRDHIKSPKVRRDIGHVEKEIRQLLSFALLEKAMPFVDHAENRNHLPRASSGNTPVYMPNGLPIVLKQSGSPKNQKRYSQMKDARDICEKNGYQLLEIPKARVYENFIIESRLPITMNGPKEQMGLYFECRDLFTDAVREFTGFLCQSTLNDIVGGTDNPFESLSETPMGRYDNISLYIEGEQGKIGLVDLERFIPRCYKDYDDWCFSKCQDLVHLFPYHIEEILEEAKKFDPTIEKYRNNLEEERAGSLKRFKLVYEDHFEFIKEKGISVQKPLEFAQLSPSRKEEIVYILLSKLKEEHEDKYFYGCLGTDPEGFLKSLATDTIPKILNHAILFIQNLLKLKLEAWGGIEAISSTPKFLFYRTLKIDPDSPLYVDVYLTPLLPHLNNFLLPILNEKLDLLDELFHSILKEMEKGREIAYYNQQLGFPSNHVTCVYC